MIKTVLFIIGFSIVFILLGISVSSISKLVTINLKLMKQIGGIIIIIFGIHMTGIFKIKFLFYEKRFMKESNSKKNISSLFLGMAFAAGWTPCIGPILSSILIYAGSMDTIGKGVFLLIMYSLGFAVPFLLFAIFIGNLTIYLKRFSKYLPFVSVVSGILMIIVGILMFTNKMSVIIQYFGFLKL